MRRLGYVYLVSTCLGVAYGSRPSAASLSLSHDEVSGDNDTQHSKQNLVDVKDQDELENQSKDEEGSPNKDADHRITQRLWQILEKHKHVLMDLQKHPDCLQVLVMGMKTNDTESDFQLTGLIHEMKSHRECTPVVMEVLVRGAGQPFWLSELFNVHPESVLIFEAFVISVLTYMIVAHLIRFFANHIAMNVKDPLACVNDPVPGPPSPVSWIVDICSHCLPCLRRVPGLDGVSTDPGSSGENLKESWKPLEGAQLKQLRSVMNKSRTLQVAGIAEQRVSGTWKLIEMAAAALTPIFISIEGMFGPKFSKQLKIVAILLSFVTTVCQVAPKNRSSALLDYHGRLRRLVFAYWSLTEEFAPDPDDEKNTEALTMGDKLFEDRRKTCFSHFVMLCNQVTQEAEDELREVYNVPVVRKLEKFPWKKLENPENRTGSTGTKTDTT